MSDELKELIVSNDAINEPAELQRRMADEGYLFFRHLQAPDKLRELRLEMMTTIQKVGWLVHDTDPMEGIADVSTQCTEGDNEYSVGYAEVYKLESFHCSAHWPEVISMVEKIAGQEIMPHPQKIARIWYPQYTDHTTPTHQDFVHFQGSFRNITCWTPVGDCPIELGGLAIIPKSHKVNRVLDHHFSLGAGGLVIDTEDHEEIDPVWYSTDYEMGDTLFFPALTIHKALPNYTENNLRLSLDNRYNLIGEPIAEHMLAPHDPSQLQWEEIYTTWESDELKYYWKQFDNPVVSRDWSFSKQSFEEALKLAKGGNEHAIYQLKRTVRNNPKTSDSATAKAVLTEIAA